MTRVLSIAGFMLLVGAGMSVALSVTARVIQWWARRQPDPCAQGGVVVKFAGFDPAPMLRHRSADLAREIRIARVQKRHVDAALAALEAPAAPAKLVPLRRRSS